MGKSKKGKKKPSIPKKDTFQRINFLYQAAHAMSANAEQQELARYYTQTMKACASKNLIRLHPHVKRTICKECQSLLLPGVSSKIRRKKKCLRMTCLNCKESKTFLSPKGYELWNVKPENIAEFVSLHKPVPFACDDTLADKKPDKQ